MATSKAQRNLVNDAHPLQSHGVARITYGDAVAKYGRRVVHQAMGAGLVYLEEVDNVDGAAFAPENASPGARLMANGVCVA